MNFLFLGDIVEILDSKRRPISKKDRKQGPYPYYGATGILDYIDGYIFDEELVLVGEDGAKWKSMDNTAFTIKGKTWVNNHAHVLRPNNEIVLNQFLIYYLNFKDLSEYVKGITVPKLNQTNLKLIPIPVPSLQEQEKIVERLDKVFKNIDKKIELNLSNKLEALKESILEEEFFNKEKFQKLEDYVKLIMGQAPPKSETNFSGKGTLFVKTGEFGDERPVSKEYTTKPLKLAKSTDVLISVVGATCGKINYGIDCAIGRSVAAIRPLSNLNQDYLYYLMKSYTKKLRKDSTGAAQTVINKNMINNVLIPDISKNDQDKTVGEIKTIFSKLENLIQLQEKVNEKLILLKKSILNNEFSYE